MAFFITDASATRAIFFGLLLALALPAASQPLDSLQAVLAREKDLTKRAALLRAIGERQMNERPAEAIIVFEELLQISKSQSNKQLQAYALNRIGNCWLNQNDLKQSIQFYFRALEATEKTDAFDDIKARVYNNLGWSFKKLEDFEKALHYFTEAEHYARRIGAPAVLGLILNNKGVTQKDLLRLDDALVSLKESLKLNEEIGNKRQVRFNLNNIAVINIEKKQLAEAVASLQQVYLLNEELRDTVELINNLQNLGTAYLAMADYTRAERAFLQGVALARGKKNAEARQKIYSPLSTVYRELGRFQEALTYFNAFYRLSDSLKAEETKKYALELESKYNGLMRERELETARKKLAEQRLYLTWIIGAFVIAVVAVIFFSRVIILKRRNERMLIELNHEIEAQSEELRQANEEVHAINENLEKLVMERTEVIRTQNARLREFAFTNAHKIRGPVASILGLVNLMGDHRHAEHTPVLLQHLHTSAKNLDKIIHEVNRQLEEEDVIPGEDLDSESAATREGSAIK